MGNIFMRQRRSSGNKSGESMRTGKILDVGQAVPQTAPTVKQGPGLAWRVCLYRQALHVFSDRGFFDDRRIATSEHGLWAESIPAFQSSYRDRPMRFRHIDCRPGE